MATSAMPGRARQQADRTWRLPVPVRRVLLLAPPLLLAVLEVAHPQPEMTTQGLLDVATWFATFHVIQLVLTGLIAISVLLLADDLARANAWATRLGVGAFLVFFGAYDTLAGIGTGLAMRSARSLTPTQQQGVFDVVKDWPGLGPVFALSIVGTVGWVLAVGGLALAARREGLPRLEWVALGLSAVFLLGGHPFPAGTIAFGSFFLAALVHDWWHSGRSRRSTARRHDRAA